MKKFLIIFFIFAICFPVLAAGDNAQKWSEASSYYKSGDYRNAAMSYERMLQTGEHSAELYYNLGSAYFKDNRLGLAILNFERALALDPSMEDAAYNLDVARVRTTDRIESVPTFFLVSWIEEFGAVFCSDSWALFSLLFLSLALAGVLICLLIRTRVLRRVGFYGAIVGMVLALVSFLYANAAYQNTLYSARAVVINTASVVRSAPETNGKELFVLHEGTTLHVLASDGEWREIRVADGNKGWLMASDIAPIQIH